MRLRSFIVSSFRSTSILLGASLALAACDWREFDDIADTTWVDTSGAPSGVDSSDFAVGLLEANNEANGELRQLAVISRSKLNLAFLSFDTDGKSTVRQSISLDTNSSGPFETLPALPVYASDPKSGKIAIVANGKLAIADASKATLDVATAPNSARSAGVTFLESAGKTYVASATERGIFFVDVAAPTTTTTACTTTGTQMSRIVALGTVRSGGADQLVVWYSTAATTAEINAYTVAIAGMNCALTAVLGTADTSLTFPTRDDYPIVEGARIVQIPGTDAVAVTDPQKNVVSIQQFGIPRVVSTFPAPDAVSLAIGAIGADTYAFVGSANYDNAGTSNAGRVQVTKLTGVSAAATPELTLNDASPDTEQRFGRAIAVIPFSDATSPIIVVGADDELFTYFRTSLYPERRVR